ncbi:MAG: dihydroorotate dehydrogenase electron transfer subunit [Candidatus Njordarchaeia archaeon]
MLRDRPRIVEITDIQIETPKVKTFKFKDDYISENSRPGQFLMIWVPKSGEIPISVSNVIVERKEVWITIAKVGETTAKMHGYKVGDKIGVRGPYGNGFDIDYDEILFIGGGYGVAPLVFASELAKKNGSKIYGIVGAKTKQDLLFINRVKRVTEKFWITTEDGSLGVKGVVTDLLERILTKKVLEPDVMLTCGPEGMIAKVYEIAKKFNISIQASLERYMKCGIGICGSCAIGEYRVCIDGPVFNTEMLRKVEPYLGRVALLPSGKKSKLSLT